MPKFFAFILSVILSVFTVAAFAQGTAVAFGSGEDNSDEPVEVTSEQLAVDQDAGTALFTGDVIVGQGDMRMFAPRVLVIYKDDDSGIDRMEARGGVTLLSGEDAAEAEQADYFVDDGNIIMSGDVLLTQGVSAITSDDMTVNTDDGTALMQGNVKSIFQSNKNTDE